MSEKERILVLARFLDMTDQEDIDLIEPSRWGTNRFEYGLEEYLVLLDDEADENVREYIEQSVWAFNPSFIIDHSKLPYDAIDMIKSFQEQHCEGANETIMALIEDFDEFVSDAISADGRGHFLSHYDGEEQEESIMREEEDGITLTEITYYIYRVN